MQRNGICLQPAGKKIGRDRHPARRDDDRPDVIQRQPPFRLPVRLAGDEPAFPAQNRAMLKDVMDRIPVESAGSNGLHSGGQARVTKSEGRASLPGAKFGLPGGRGLGCG